MCFLSNRTNECKSYPRYGLFVSLNIERIEIFTKDTECFSLKHTIVINERTKKLIFFRNESAPFFSNN